MYKHKPCEEVRHLQEFGRRYLLLKWVPAVFSLVALLLIAQVSSSSGVEPHAAFVINAAQPSGVEADPVMVGAGDIATCTDTGDDRTADLLDGIAGIVFTLGDNVYQNGTPDEFSQCYDPTWGRHKTRTYPMPGNHDYRTTGAAGYFGYFGAAAGDPAKGYYSYDVGPSGVAPNWHIIVLNSNCSFVQCAEGSEQELWLREELLNNLDKNVLAMWHHPRYSSGIEHGNDPRTQPFWEDLYRYGADLLLTGHAHSYERFAPQNSDGALDTAYGIRQFVVGTGGSSLTGFDTPEPNSEVRSGDNYGVLKLTLNSDSYDWEFVPESGGVFTDTGSTSTHGAPPGVPSPTSTATVIATATATATTIVTGIVTSTPATPSPIATATPCAIAPFEDVPPSSTFYQYVRCLVCRGIVTGYPDNTFRPSSNVTRGQLAKIVSNAAGFSEPMPAGRQSFEDIPGSHTFYEFIERLYARGIINGYDCGGVGEPCVPPADRPYFRPADNASRGQVSKIVASAAGLNEPVVGQTFEDVAEGSTFYVWIERLAQRGVMEGYLCGGPGEPCGPGNSPYFRPGNRTTRGQMSKIVANALLPGCELS